MISLVNSCTARRFITLILLAIGCSAAFCTDEAPVVSSLPWYVARTKAEGRSSIVIPASHGIPAVLRTLEDALKFYSAVIVMPEAKSAGALDRFHIGTWYKMKVVDWIYQHAPQDDVDRGATPDAFKPVAKDELVTYVHGGSIVMEGVNLSTPFSTIPELSLGQKYLLFILVDPTGQFGYLHAGVNAVFTVTGSDWFDPLSKVPSKFQEHLQNRTRSSLAILKAEASHVSDVY